jgi:hypothetical protein
LGTVVVAKSSTKAGSFLAGMANASGLVPSMMSRPKVGAP